MASEPTRSELLRPGSELSIGPEASPQFRAGNGFIFRVVRPMDWSTYDGWVWLEGYVLNGAADAVQRRCIFVRVAGLRPASPWPWATRTCAPSQELSG